MASRHVSAALSQRTEFAEGRHVRTHLLDGLLWEMLEEQMASCGLQMGSGLRVCVGFVTRGSDGTTALRERGLGTSHGPQHCSASLLPASTRVFLPLCQPPSPVQDTLHAPVMLSLNPGPWLSSPRTVLPLVCQALAPHFPNTAVMTDLIRCWHGAETFSSQSGNP